MSGITLTAQALSQATVSAQQLAVATGNTFGSNATWFVLVATVGAILTIVYWLMRRIARLGR